MWVVWWWILIHCLDEQSVSIVDMQLGGALEPFLRYSKRLACYRIILKTFERIFKKLKMSNYQNDHAIIWSITRSRCTHIQVTLEFLWSFGDHFDHSATSATGTILLFTGTILLFLFNREIKIILHFNVQNNDINLVDILRL